MAAAGLIDENVGKIAEIFIAPSRLSEFRVASFRQSPLTKAAVVEQTLGRRSGQENRLVEIYAFFSPFGAPEYHPGSKIAGEILEPVLNVGGYKKAVALFEWVTLPFNYQLTRSPVDEIDFILLVWRLRIMPDGGVIFDGHGAMRQRNGKTFSHWPFYGYRAGNTGAYFFNSGFNFQ
jgi:hypothetical protein